MEPIEIACLILVVLSLVVFVYVSRSFRRAAPHKNQRAADFINAVVAVQAKDRDLVEKYIECYAQDAEFLCNLAIVLNKDVLEGVKIPLLR